MEKRECPRCGNKDPTYFYKGHKGYYCRKCVCFKRILLDEENRPMDYEVDTEAATYLLKYPLTSFQKKASNRCLELIKTKDVLLHAVCGAGKTEIVVESIASYLKKGLKVAYAISRKEVVIELEKRFAEIFSYAKVVGVYGGHHEVLIGDLIVCTVHQLFRYQKTFDLLILDEVDAFPLKGNRELMNIALNSAKGKIIFSTATVNSFLFDCLKKRDYEEVCLDVRPSLKPLIEPVLVEADVLYLYYRLLKLVSKMDKQYIIFVPSKNICRNLYFLLKRLFNITFVYAESKDRTTNIRAFKDKEYQFILATTVLERGITIYDVNVIILNVLPGVFDCGSLVQMLGRVGRNFNNPYGEAYILSRKNDEEVKLAIEEIRRANKSYELSLL